MSGIQSLQNNPITDTFCVRIAIPEPIFHTQNPRVAIQPSVYILTNKRNGTLYVGVTANLAKRIWIHREGMAEGFSKKYLLKQLVYYEFHDSMPAAIEREKRLKRWRRFWKIHLIEEVNPEWEDLYWTL